MLDAAGSMIPGEPAQTGQLGLSLRAVARTKTHRAPETRAGNDEVSGQLNDLQNDRSHPWILGWLSGYRAEWFRPDIVAGLTTGAVVIPKARPSPACPRR